MINEVRLLKALADENRLRLLMLLRARELFVCQLMAVTGLSQSLVSRSLALLERQGLVVSRREGKHVFYHLNESMPTVGHAVLDALARRRHEGPLFAADLENLDLFCRRFHGGQACDMSIVKKFIAFKNKKQFQGA
jgi:ArsR family transcriptional regulator